MRQIFLPDIAKFLISRNKRIAKIPHYIPIVMAFLVGFSQVRLFKRTWDIFKEGHYTGYKTSFFISINYMIFYPKMRNFYNNIFCKTLCLKDVTSLIPFNLEDFERAKDNKCSIHDFSQEYAFWNPFRWKYGG